MQLVGKEAHRTAGPPISSCYCHFCGKGNLDPRVKVMVTELNGGNICDGCINTAAEVLAEHDRRVNGRYGSDA